MPTLHIAIVGGGAAGLFAAITAKHYYPDTDVCIFEKNNKLLAKVAITGGGRCNLTNSFADIADLSNAYPRGHKLIKRLFNTFDYDDVYQWFEDHGVPLVTQEDNCVFPRSQDSQSIIDCLISTARQLGVKFRLGCTITSIEQTLDGKLCLTSTCGQAIATQKQHYDRVAVTTGGSPQMKGLEFLSPVVRKLESPVASLFTLTINERRLQSMMGTVVNPVTVSIPSTKFKAEGPLLITHWGVSGPAVLKLSSYAARFLHDANYHSTLAVNWINRTHHHEVEQEFYMFIASNANKMAGNVHPFNLTSRLWTYILEKCGCPADRRMGELGKKMINKLIDTLTNDQYTIAGKGKFKDEFVTCGGVALGELNLNTLESKHCPHLFFAGEVTDVDGITGGFNLQAAWTMGYVVGMNIGKA